MQNMFTLMDIFSHKQINKYILWRFSVRYTCTKHHIKVQSPKSRNIVCMYVDREEERESKIRSEVSARMLTIKEPIDKGERGSLAQIERRFQELVNNNPWQNYLFSPFADSRLSQYVTPPIMNPSYIRKLSYNDLRAPTEYTWLQGRAKDAPRG